MSVISGKDGAVNGHGIVRGWSISHTADVQKAIASNTLGGVVTLAGNKNWSGTFRQYGHIPTIIPGEAFTFTGSVDGSTGATGPARVTSITLIWGHEDSSIIGTEIAFQANGALTLGAAAATDTSDFENVEGSMGLAVQTQTPGGSWEALDDVRSAQLTITAANQDYRSSSTAGETKSTEGNWDWSLAIDMYSGADVDALPAVNVVKGIRLFVNATEFWELLWGRVSEVSNLEISPETAEIVSATLNLSMHGIETIATVVTDGSIKHPDGVTPGALTTIWP